jgi:hypothetical protein
MRNFWNNFSNGFWTEIKEKQFIWNLLETVIFVLLFSFVNTLVTGGDDASYASMLAGAALFVAISNQRRLDNQ